MVFQKLHLVLAFLLGLLCYSCFSGKYCIYLYISLSLSSSLVTNSFFLPILLFSTFLYVLLLGCCGVIVLFLLLNLLFLVYKFDFSLVLALFLLTIFLSLVFLSLTFQLFHCFDYSFILLLYLFYPFLQVFFLNQYLFSLPHFLLYLFQLYQYFVLIIVFYPLLPVWSPTQPICLFHTFPWYIFEYKVKPR